STSTLYQNDTWKTVFTPTTHNIYSCLYCNLPDITFSEKIIKLRKINNLERTDLSSILNLHIDTIFKWESGDVYPLPESIKSICKSFNLDFSYWGDYYYTYYNNPADKIKLWKLNNNYTYATCSSILNITPSCFGRLINNKIALSYSMYLKLKTIGVF
ncbi:MAG: helix-turn-helix transcriptional regulator, partial [Clostridium sp.]|uniref:helix-turn-helix domain-containing protein n=1 Tax=Clostridium sp. TaxID=1506 RepID=UPI003217733D